VESWYGLYAPAGTPPDVIAKLNAAVKKAANSPEFAKKIEQEGLSVVASEPAELDRYVKAEEARWRKIVKENNIKAE
jgi:tripartite-type tricarboxylate transporter receptor subunit TctC